MRNTFQRDIIRDALKRAPQLIEGMNQEQANVLRSHYLENKELTTIANEMKTPLSKVRASLECAKRNAGFRALQEIANDEATDCQIHPKEIWGDNEMMKSFLAAWCDVSSIVERLIESPSEGLRDMAVTAIFKFFRNHQKSLRNIIEHPYIKVKGKDEQHKHFEI